jgi:hypothetical protein
MIGFISTLVTISLNHKQHSAIADLHTLVFTVAHALGFSVFTSRLLATDLNTETVTLNHFVLLALVRSELTALVIYTRSGPQRKHSSIVDDVTALHRTVRYAEMCLPRRCLETDCINPLFYFYLSQLA